MIGRLSGTLIEKQPPQIVLDVNGVGYELDVPMGTFYDLPALGAPATLFVHHVVREDAHLLYGFATRNERDTFRSLIRITGIGPKIALAILSGMNADELALAIASEDTARLAKVPGIGKKTAERLVLELRGKLSGLSSAVSMTGKAALPLEATPRQDILHALLALGYNEREAAMALKQVPEEAGVNEGIKLALKSLVRG